VARFPRSFEVRLEYARHAATAGNSAQALETFEALGAAAPDDRAVARRLCNLCLFVGQLDRAAAPLQRLLGADEPTAEDHVLAARLARARGDLTAALDFARTAVRAAPESAAAHHELARVLLEANAPDEAAATAELEAALALDPGLAEARFLLGTLLLQAGDELAGQRALDAGTLAEQLTSADFRARPAEERLQRAHQLAARIPDWSRPWLEVARAELELGRPKKAELSLARAGELRPDDVERLKLLFAAAKAAGRTQLADQRLAAWREARTTSP